MMRYRIKRIKKASPPPMLRAGPYLPVMDGFSELNQYGTHFKRTSPVRESSKPYPREILNEIMKNYYEVTNLPELPPRKSPRKSPRRSSIKSPRRSSMKSPRSRGRPPSPPRPIRNEGRGRYHRRMPRHSPFPM